METIIKKMIRFVVNANARRVLIVKSAGSTLFVPYNFSAVGVLCSTFFPLLQILPSVSLMVWEDSILSLAPRNSKLCLLEIK